MRPILLLLLLATLPRADAAPRYSGRYGPSHGFSVGHCKRASCFARHPGGTFVHPNTGGERRPH